MERSASVEYIRILMNFMTQLRIDVDQVYQKAGFDPSILEKSGTRIPEYQCLKLWGALEEVNTNPDLGLHIGESVSVFPGHILFMLMFNAHTVKDAIEKFCRYFNLFTDAYLPYLSTDNNLTSLTLRYNITDWEPTRVSNEGILTAYAYVLHGISDNAIQFEGVYFMHPRPDDISEHKRIFNAPLFFDQPENKLVFQKQFLKLPILLSNNNLLLILEDLAKRLQEKIYPYRPWSEKVSQIITDMLKNHQAQIDCIAKQLAISPRNLQKQLKKEDVTYKKLLDDIRKEQALYLLENEKIPISEIAFMVGYSDQSVFNRAFKRWVGSTPREYRSQFK